MGQKVSPIGMRVGVNIGKNTVREWNSSWYADKDFSKFLGEDIKVRKYLEKEIGREALLSKVNIQRVGNNVQVQVWVARPGVVLGQDGAKAAELTKQLVKICHGAKVDLSVEEVKNPDLDATIVATQIAIQLEQRASFRMAQKKAIQKVMKAGAKGIKTSVSGRLGGADIARAEGYSEGVVPLHTLRADIDFAIAEAATTYGKLGVRVYICRGEVLPDKKETPVEVKGE